MGVLPLQPVRAGDQRGRREPACASSLGLSPDAIAAANWAIGSALAGMAAILIAPIVGQLSVATMTNLVLAALAAALVAGFRSFPVAFRRRHRASARTNWAASWTRRGSLLPFGVIIAWMIVRGQALPLRDYFSSASRQSAAAGYVRAWWGLHSL